MDTATFWAMITATRGDVDERIPQLQTALTQLHEDAITGFADRLAELLHQLDTPEHARHAESRGDAFLYIRCAVVMKGPDVYTKVLTKPRSIKRYQFEDAEPLLFVAPSAYEASTGRAWEHDTPLNFETGSNTTAWQDAPVQQQDDDGEEWLKSQWLLVNLGFMSGQYFSPEYELTSVLVCDVMNADNNWRDWWRQNQPGHLEAVLIFDPAQPNSADIKRGRKLVRAKISRTHSGYNSTEGADAAQIACDDIAGLLEIVRTALDLREPPAFPPPPPIPHDLLEVQRRAHGIY
jgi:hypothetical protein